MPDAFPLCWPATWPRVPPSRRLQSAFGTGFTAARDGLLYELRLLGARGVILSSNVRLRLDGLPYAGEREPDDPGVAVFFDLNKRPRCIPCDRWSRVRDNLQAIRKTVEALRGLERWGTGRMVEAGFTGFAALPAATPAGESWWTVLGVEPTATLDQVRAAWREKSRDAHPDRGGTTEGAARINAAMDAAEKALTPA